MTDPARASFGPGDEPSDDDELAPPSSRERGDDEPGASLRDHEPQELDVDELDLVDVEPDANGELADHGDAGLDVGGFDLVGDDPAALRERDAADAVEIALDDDPAFDDAAHAPDDTPQRDDPFDLGIDADLERDDARDGGEEGASDELELDEADLPPLDADSEHDSALDLGFEEAWLRADGDARWESAELVPGRFACVATGGDLLVAGGDALHLRYANGSWQRVELEEPIVACAVSDGWVAVATPTRVRLGTLSPANPAQSPRWSVEHRLESALQLALVRAELLVLDRHSRAFRCSASGELELLDHGVLGLAATAAGAIWLRRDQAGALHLERMRGDDHDRQSALSSAPMVHSAQASTRLVASPRGDVAWVAGERLAFAFVGTEKLSSTSWERVAAASFGGRTESPCLAVATLEPWGIALHLPADLPSCERVGALRCALSPGAPAALAWDPLRDAFVLASAAGLLELRRVPAH